MNVLTLDCEFNQPSGKLIEIGAAAYEVRSGHLLEKFQTFVDPGEAINPEITSLTTITDLNVQGAPSAREAYFLLKRFHQKHQCFMNPIVWGSGERNDSSAIYRQADPGEPNFMGFRVIDAKVIYQSVMMFENRKVRGGLVSSMGEMDLSFEGRPHTALADAINTFRLWYCLVRKFHDGLRG